jgi:predicted nicotinamide N-methyase
MGVTLASGEVEVTTEIRWSVLYSAPIEFEPTPEQRARDELEGLLYDGQALLREPRSEPAQALDEAAAHRQAEARASAAPMREIIIELDGEPVPFACVQHDACWAAAAHIDDRTITVATRAVPAVAVTLHTRR